MSIFFTGSVKIIKVSQDDNGLITETIGPEISARVEEFNKLIIDQFGQEKLAEFIIYIDKSKTITISDKIMIITKEKLPYYDPTKKWKIIKLSKIGGFSAHHIEVYL